MWTQGAIGTTSAVFGPKGQSTQPRDQQAMDGTPMASGGTASSKARILRGRPTVAGSVTENVAQLLNGQPFRPRWGRPTVAGSVTENVAQLLNGRPFRARREAKLGVSVICGPQFKPTHVAQAVVGVPVTWDHPILFGEPY
eukprot:s188_g47.t1